MLSKEQTDPNNDATFTFYTFDSGAETIRTYTGWAWVPGSNDFTHDTTTNLPPIQISRDDSAGFYTELVTFADPGTDLVTSGTNTGAPVGDDVLTSLALESLSRSAVDNGGQVTETDDYFDLSGITYSAATYQLGSAYSISSFTVSNTNYHQTFYFYTEMGLVKREINPNDTITRTFYDGLNRVTSVWVGTNDTPTGDAWYNFSPSNMAGTDMVQISANVYDKGGVGDSTLTTSIQFPNGSRTGEVTNFRVTEMAYDWRDRLIATKQGVLVSEVAFGGLGYSTALIVDGISNAATPERLVDDYGSESSTGSTERPITYNLLDNLGNTLSEYVYTANGVTLDSFLSHLNSDGTPDSYYAGALRAQTFGVRRPAAALY